MTDFELQMLVVAATMVGLVLQGCTPLVEVNMVSRSTLSDGETIRSSQQDVTTKREEASMELIVPIK